jgi:hypothetical protein
VAQQGGAGSGRVTLGARLAGSSAAPAVPAVVEREYVQARRCEQLDVRHAVADVAGVAVEEEDVADRRRRRGNPPAVEPLAVIGLDRDVRVRDAGRPRERTAGEVQQRVQQWADANIFL